MRTTSFVTCQKEAPFNNLYYFMHFIIVKCAQFKLFSYYASFNILTITFYFYHIPFKLDSRQVAASSFADV